MKIKFGNYWGLENKQFTLLGATYYENYYLYEIILELFNFYVEVALIKKENQMKKLILLIAVCMPLMGCSLLKVATAPFKSTVSTTPQQTTKNSKQMRCKGEIEVKENGSIYCSDGFYLSEVQSDQRDRKLSMREKIGQWIMGVSGWFFWLIVISIALTATGFGWVVSLVWNSIFVLGRILRQVISGIQKAKNNGGDFVAALNASTDEDVKKFIAQFKLNNGIK